MPNREARIAGATYPANGCIECDALFGDFFLGDLILDYVDYDEGAELMDRFINDVEPHDAVDENPALPT